LGYLVSARQRPAPRDHGRLTGHFLGEVLPAVPTDGPADVSAHAAAEARPVAALLPLSLLTTPAA
jgi:hypothetical protein